MHTEISEELVLYRSLNGDDRRWLRPLSMFTESVVWQGVMQQRFVYNPSHDIL